MQNKYLKFLLILLVVAFIIPQITLAAWWNPFSWGWDNFFRTIFHNPPPITQQNQNNNSQTPLTEGNLRSATLTYPNPYDVSKNDTIKLSGGHALIYDTGNTKPRGYDVGATAIGNLDGDGVAEGAIGVYQGWGANRITPIIFVFSNKNNTLTQIDSVVPDTSNWQDETQIKSLSINKGILSVNLLVLAEKDQNLPHYQQQASVAKTVQYKLVNGKLVEQANQTADWKTYTNTQYGFSITFPDSWKGYSVIENTWNGISVDTPAKYQGPEFTFRNPKWTAQNRWQDIPIMVITPDVWKLMQEEKIGVSAAPVGPSKIGENTKYIFATPPRWYGFTEYLGMQEAVDIVKTFKAF